MEKQERKKLVVELTKKLQFAKFQAKGSEEKSKGMFIHGKTTFNPKYISNNQYFQIAQFYRFLKANENLTDEEIRNILNSKKLKFAFLIECDKLIPDFFEELKLHGTMTMAITYVRAKHGNEILGL